MLVIYFEFNCALFKYKFKCSGSGWSALFRTLYCLSLVNWIGCTKYLWFIMNNASWFFDYQKKTLKILLEYNFYPPSCNTRCKYNYLKIHDFPNVLNRKKWKINMCAWTIELFKMYSTCLYLNPIMLFSIFPYVYWSLVYIIWLLCLAWLPSTTLTTILYNEN